MKVNYKFNSALFKLKYTNKYYSTITKSINNEDVIRRSLFYVPGNSERKLTSANKLKSDNLTFDLEDSVPFNKKMEARNMVLNTIDQSSLNCEIAVRINSLGSGFEKEDLEIVLKSKRLDAIVIPKVHSKKEVEFVEEAIHQFQNPLNQSHIKLIASIESAQAIVNLKEIVTASNRLKALIFAAEDFCADLDLKRTAHRRELLYGRSKVVAYAKAFGLQAIDLVCLDFRNSNILKEECLEGYQMGFTGKQAIHPAQIEVIQQQFLPSEEDIAWANKILKGYEEFAKLGQGAFELEGKVIDQPVVKWAFKLLERVPKKH